MEIPSREFRWDLQGLRAISVLLVILFHINENIVSAGFFGVDVFFVISGFVITGLLLREFDKSGRIDVLQFYARRAKRLLPNASLVLVVVLLVAAALGPVYALRDLANDVMAAAIYLANFHFADIKVDYFSSNRAPSAVIHYWSLSVEEQFYIIWPVLMLLVGLLVAKLRQFAAISGLLIAAWIFSFLFCIITVQSNQPLAFFHTAARIWELATGALIALHTPMLARRFKHIRENTAWAGMGMILAASLFVGESTTHPGFVTLIPIFGTALLIIAGLGQEQYGTTPVSRFLATKPMIWLGDRSYSLYLWHWPVIVFCKEFLGHGIMSMALAVVLSFALAQLAYRYVETPLRHGTWSTGSSLRQLAPALALIAVVCFTAYTAPKIARQFVSVDKEYWVAAVRRSILDDGGVPYRDKCHLGDEMKQPECLYGDKKSAKTVVLFGDSHAAHWFPAFEKATRIAGWQLHSWSKSSCPSADITIWNPYKKAKYSSCSLWRKSIMARLKAAKKPHLVILSNSNGYSGWTLAPDSTKVIAGRAAEDEFERGLTKTVKALLAMGHKVAIIRDTPLADPKYRDCVSKNGDSKICTRPRTRAINQNKVEARVAALFPNVSLIRVNDMICGHDTCPVVKKGEVIYRDDSHLTIVFMETLYQPILDLLRKYARQF